MNSDLLLLLPPNQPYEIPRKPLSTWPPGLISALTQAGATSNLIKRSGGTVWTLRTKIKQIKKAVLECYLKWTSAPSDTDSFDRGCSFMRRRELTKRCVDLGAMRVAARVSRVYLMASTVCHRMAIKKTATSAAHTILGMLGIAVWVRGQDIAIRFHQSRVLFKVARH